MKYKIKDGVDFKLVNKKSKMQYDFNLDGNGKDIQIEVYEQLIEKLKQENQKYKEVIDRLNFIKNRKNQGASQENINKMAIEFVNSYLKEVK